MGVSTYLIAEQSAQGSSAAEDVEVETGLQEEEERKL